MSFLIYPDQLKNFQNQTKNVIKPTKIAKVQPEENKNLTDNWLNLKMGLENSELKQPRAQFKKVMRAFSKKLTRYQDSKSRIYEDLAQRPIIGPKGQKVNLVDRVLKCNLLVRNFILTYKWVYKDPKAFLDPNIVVEIPKQFEKVLKEILSDKLYTLFNNSVREPAEKLELVFQDLQIDDKTILDLIDFINLNDEVLIIQKLKNEIKKQEIELESKYGPTDEERQNIKQANPQIKMVLEKDERKVQSNKYIESGKDFTDHLNLLELPQINEKNQEFEIDNKLLELDDIDLYADLKNARCKTVIMNKKLSVIMEKQESLPVSGDKVDIPNSDEEKSAEGIYKEMFQNLKNEFDEMTFEIDDYQKYEQAQERIDDILVLSNRLLYGIKRDLKQRFDNSLYEPLTKKQREKYKNQGPFSTYDQVSEKSDGMTTILDGMSIDTYLRTASGSQLENYSNYYKKFMNQNQNQN